MTKGKGKSTKHRIFLNVSNNKNRPVIFVTFNLNIANNYCIIVFVISSYNTFLFLSRLLSHTFDIGTFNFLYRSLVLVARKPFEKLKPGTRTNEHNELFDSVMRLFN